MLANQIGGALFALAAKEPDPVPASQEFYALFIYGGEQPTLPTGADPILKLMQLQDMWIAFSDDEQVVDCARCTAPFSQCEDQGIQFCHARFPTTPSGTVEAVQTLLDVVGTSPSTAFIVSYTLDDATQESDGQEMNARTVQRFPVGGSGDDPPSSSSAAKTWTIVGIVALFLIAAIVGFAIYMSKRKAAESTAKEVPPPSTQGLNAQQPNESARMNSNARTASK